MAADEAEFKPVIGWVTMGRNLSSTASLSFLDLLHAPAEATPQASVETAS